MKKKIDFSEEELRYLEKLCDNQASGIYKEIRKLAELMLTFNILSQSKEGYRKEQVKVMGKQFDEWGRASMVVKSIRNKIEKCLGEKK